MPPPGFSDEKTRLPSWAWGLVAVGVVMALAGFAVLYVAFQETQGLQMAGEIPKRGVPLTRPDEQLAPGSPGELRFKNRNTGAIRTIRHEGQDAPLPTWLTLPEEFQRITASARRGEGRREASYQYVATLPVHEAVAHFSRVLTAAGLTVRASETRVADSMVVGEGAGREAFVRIVPRTGSLRVTITTTEPAE